MSGLQMFQLVLVIFALGCALIAAFFYIQQSPPATRRPHFGWLAFAFWLTSVLVGYIPK